MSDRIAIQTADLWASAGIAKTLSDELDKPVQAALNTSTTVSTQLTGWSISGGLGQLGTGWAKPLGDLRQRLADTATNLNANASAHEHRDQAVAGGWAVPQQGPK
ncbi:hypothetical protein [Streptomyces sp. CBMA156]|uniref:hypothetical protein n=1 Tax=Streptomyces sp. CBMA156 TaxID=1930280 RepID=UPI0016619CC1|nr:hypothetical protein [Streptomyces sp. CBMA156]MBD0670116.1 hypothetical protein [Streptomyces sp. CBMA156]